MKQFMGKVLKGQVVSLHKGDNEDLSKQDQAELFAEINGFAGDKHQGSRRKAFSGEWEPEGTIRRNERHWSGVSVEELTQISNRLGLMENLRPATLGANLCIKGIEKFSLLPKGTKLVFPSGAVLLIEEYNPPCTDMGEKIAESYTTKSAVPLNAKTWLRPAAGRRGVVGVIDVPGVIRVGDEVEVRVFENPSIRLL